MADLYETLGIRRGASEEDIKAAHRVAIKRTHPDAGGETAEFCVVQVAYEILIDPDKRASYDATGEINAKADNRNAQALAIITGLFDGVMAAILNAPPGQDLITNDVVEVMRDDLTGRIEKISADIAKAQDTIKRLRDLAGRFKSTTERNVLRGMIENKIEVLERNIPNMREILVLHEAALEILNGQSFEFDPAPSASQNPYCGAAVAAAFAFNNQFNQQNCR